MVEARDEIARNSSNYRQFLLSRDTSKAACELEAKMNTSWSQFQGKEELGEYLHSLRQESLAHREEVRSLVRRRVSSCLAEDSLTARAVAAHQAPWSKAELEEEERMREETELRAEERVAALRLVTEQMLTARNEYAVSTRDLVMRAIKEDEASVKASRSSRKVTTVQQGSVAA